MPERSSASRSEDAPTTSRPVPSRSSRLPAGTTARAKPRRSASRSRATMRWTRRSSPPRPSSPMKTVRGSAGRSRSADATATARPRSAAGSRIRRPPTRFTYTSCERALLRHVADQEDRDVVALRELEEARRALAELRDPAGRGPDGVRAHRLDRVDDDERRPHAADGLDDRAEIGLGEEQDAFAGDAEPARPHLHLRGGLLAGHVERGASLGERGARLHEERALPDAGIAPEHDERSAHDPSA